ncbi:MAG: DUF5063 domain-containing protein [Patescibacteria group bacterium]|jgi:hypothetical protein
MKNDAINQFALIAKEYCNFIENHKFKKNKSVYKLIDILIKLYSSALKLPKVKTGKNHHILDHVNQKMYTKITKKLFKEFTDFKFYWLIFNPLIEDKNIDDEVVKAGVYDDLADIYRDVKNGLIEYQENSLENITDAVWHWRFHFYTHWGDHLVSLLKPLNSIIEDDFVEND